MLDKFTRTSAIAALLSLPLAAPAGADTVKSGTFKGAGGHKSVGGVKIVRSGNTVKVVFESSFWYDGAPDPRVAFGNGSYTPGTIIARLRAKRGAQSYQVPAGINVAKFSQVWIWCQKFNSPIAVASLK